MFNLKEKLMRTFTQKLAFLLVAVLSCWSLQIKADDLTVADGTKSSSYLPVYGLYVDTENSHQQCLYPADSLTDIAGGTISKMTFYLATPASALWSGAVIQVSLGETSVSSLSSGFVTTGLTAVYTGALDATQPTMEIVFDEEFAYSGENLVVDFLVVTEGDYKSAYFYGVDNVAGSGRYAYESYNSTTENPLDFLPKVTFDFVGGSGLSCSKPSSIVASDVATNSATLTWAEGSGVFNVEYKKASATAWTSLLSNSSALSANLSGLEANTSYQARVQSVCADLDTVSGWRTVNFKTACGVIASFPYSLDFEDIAAGSFPACWDNSASGSPTAAGSNPHYVWGVYAYGGNKMIRMYNYYVSSGTALVNTPSIILPETPEYELTFDYSHRANCGAFAVKVSEDGGANWTELQSFEKPEEVSTDKDDPGDFMPAVVSLADYAGKSIMLQFFATSNYGQGSIFIDNISIYKHSDCAMPVDLAVSDVTKESASVSWTPGGLENTWILQYKQSASEDWISTVISENPFLLEGLEPYTSYNVRVAARCAEDDQSKFTKAVSFTSAAGVPFVENFASAISSDWNRYAVLVDEVMNGDTTLTEPVSSGWSVSSGNGVFPGASSHLMLGIYGTGMHHWIVSPAIEMEDNVQLTFDLALTKSSGTLQPVVPGEQEDDKFYVLYSLDGGLSWDVLKYWDNGSSEEAFDLISCSAEGQIVKINLSEFAGESMSFAFYGESTAEGGNNYIHISNVRVDYIPSCEKPMGLSVSGVSSHSATMVWDEAEDGAATWQYALVANPASDFIPSDELFANSTDELSVELDGLEENTPYAFFLRRACVGSNSEYIVRNFRTSQTPAALPFEDDFEDGLKWVLLNDDHDNKWVLGEALNNGGSHSLYISNDNGVTNAYNNEGGLIIYATKAFDFAEDGMYNISFDWKCNGESSYDLFCAALIPDGLLLEPGVATGQWSLPEGWIALHEGIKLNQQTTWQHSSFELEMNEPGVHTIALVWRQDGSMGTNPPAAVDNFRISRMSCPAPADIVAVAGSATTSSIQLEWTPKAGESQWLLQYRKAGSTQWIYASDDVDIIPFTLDGLDAASIYDVRVAAWCNPEDSASASDFSAAASFATDCEAITSFPYVANFDELTPTSEGHVLPVCWSFINTSTNTTYAPYPTVVQDDYAATLPNSLALVSYFNSYTDYDPQDQFAILPEMEGINGLRMKLLAGGSEDYYGNLYDATFAVGVMTDPEDASSFVQMASISPASEDYAQYTVSFADYSGEGKYIAIKLAAADNSYRVVYIDNLRVEEIPSCMDVEGLNILRVAADSVSFSWNVEEGESYVYAIAPAGAAEPTAGAFAPASDSMVVGGLNDNTDYLLYLRRNCGSSMGVSISASFHTLQSPVAVPFADNFEGANNWLFTNSANHGWVLGSAVHNGDGTHAMYVSADNGSSCSYVISATNIVYAAKSFSFESGSYIFQFDWLGKGEGASNDWDYLRAALVPADASLQAGIIPAGFKQNTLPEGWIALDGGSLLNMQDNWQTLTTEEIAVPAGNFMVVFAWKNDASAGSNPAAAIDNFSISKVACGKPANLKAEDLTFASAKLSWLADAAQNAWQIVLTDDANLSLSDATPIDVASNPYVAAGLNEDTDYYFYVRANCGVDGFSAWSARASFHTAKACQLPDGFELTDLTTNSASLRWTTYGQTAFNVRYSADTLAGWNDLANVAMPLDLNGLETNTVYFIKVQPVCASDEEWTEVMNFRTECEIFSLPFAENFNSLTAGIPSCWNNDEGTTTSAAYKWNYHATGHDGACLRFDSYSNPSNNNNVLATPPVYLDKDAQLTFWCKNPAGGNFEVYISKDGAEPVKLLGNLTSIADWTEQEINLSAYTGGNVVIYFLGVSNYAYGDGYLYLDDVVIDELPACPKATGLHLVGVKDIQASFAWDAVEGATWEYGFVQNASVDFVAADTDFSGNTSLNEITLNGLNPLTEYLFFMRRACGEENSQILYIAFKTTSTPEALPFADDFESDKGWSLINGACENAWVRGDAVDCDWYNVGSSHALYISNDGGISHAYTVNSQAMVYAAKLFDFDKAGTYTVEYDWRANGESNYDFLRVALVPASVELAAASTAPAGFGYSSLPADWIALDEGSKLNLNDEWSNKSVEVELEPALYYIVFAWRNDNYTGTQAPAAVDNIVISHKAYPTDIQSGAGIENKAVKFIHNDHVYIMLNGTVYTVTGQKVELK